jgi:large subunit ribosomal protein L24e
MVDTRSCDYCGSDIEPGTGTMFVYTDGRVVHYCSSKCENNADLGRASRDLEWTAEGQRAGASSAGTPEEAEQVAAEPPAGEETEAEAEVVADEVDTVEAESEAEAVAAATGDAGSRSGEPAAAEDERVDDAAEADTEELNEVAGRRAGGTDPDIDEDETATSEGATGEETDPDEAEANVDDEETVRETDESEESE